MNRVNAVFTECLWRWILKYIQDRPELKLSDHVQKKLQRVVKNCFPRSVLGTNFPKTEPVRLFRFFGNTEPKACQSAI